MKKNIEFNKMFNKMAKKCLKEHKNLINKACRAAYFKHFLEEQGASFDLYIYDKYEEKLIYFEGLFDFSINAIHYTKDFDDKERMKVIDDFKHLLGHFNDLLEKYEKLLQAKFFELLEKQSQTFKDNIFKCVCDANNLEQVPNLYSKLEKALKKYKLFTEKQSKLINVWLDKNKKNTNLKAVQYILHNER